MFVTGVNFSSNNNRVQKMNTHTRASLSPSYDSIKFGNSIPLPLEEQKISSILFNMQRNLSNALKEHKKGKYIGKITNERGETIGHRYSKKGVSTTYDLQNRRIESRRSEGEANVVEKFYPDTQKTKSIKYIMGEDAEVIHIIKFDEEGKKNKELFKYKNENEIPELLLKKYVYKEKVPVVVEEITRTQREEFGDGTFYNTTRKVFLPDDSGTVILDSKRDETRCSKFSLNPETGETESYERNVKGKKTLIKQDEKGNILESREIPPKGESVWKKFNPEKPEELIFISREIPTTQINAKTGKPLFRILRKEIHPKNPDKMIVTKQEPGQPATSYEDNKYII